MSSSKNILLLHGWGSSKKSWEKVQSALAKKGLNLVIPDMPGFGDSPPPERAWYGADYQKWVLSFIRENHFQLPITLIGHSFGGGLAMKIAVDHPELVDKLILIAAARLYVKKSFLKRLVSKAAKWAKKFDFVPFFDLIRKGAYKYIVRSTDYTRSSGVMKETFVNIIKEDLTASIHKIKAPTMIIWGDKDQATPLEHAYLLNDRVAGSKLEIMKGAGHALNIEHPEKLAELIYSFLKN